MSAVSVKGQALPRAPKFVRLGWPCADADIQVDKDQLCRPRAISTNAAIGAIKRKAALHFSAEVLLAIGVAFTPDPAPSRMKIYKALALEIASPSLTPMLRPRHGATDTRELLDRFNKAISAAPANSAMKARCLASRDWRFKRQGQLESEGRNPAGEEARRRGSEQGQGERRSIKLAKAAITGSRRSTSRG